MGDGAWSDPRGVVTGARALAHTDDAKHRVDETSRVPSPRSPRLVVAAVAGAVLLVVAGGTAVTLTSGRHSTARASRPSPRAPASGTRSSAAPTTARGIVGRTFTLSGRASRVVQPFAGEAGYSSQDAPVTYTVSCTEAACTLSTTGLRVELPRTGPGEYTLTQPREDVRPDGTVSYVHSFRLVVAGTSATLVNQVVKGGVSASGVIKKPPQTATLTAPMVFTS